MHSIFALTTYGLEDVSAEEMTGLPGLSITARGYRRIAAGYAGDLSRLMDLRTVDDIYLWIGSLAGVAPQRAALEHFTQWSRDLDLSGSAAAIGTLRPIAAQPSFSVTASFVGKRNYTTDEIKSVVSTEISSHWGWRYGGENETDLNLRVFIEHDQAYAGLRLSGYPLHSRLYKQAHLSGSLKPPVAAAMVKLAQGWPEGRLLDPFCGAGTIPIEASMAGMRVCGGDRDGPALAAASENAGRAGVRVSLAQLDARRLPMERFTFDFVVSNMPWGRQVRVDEPLVALYRASCAEIERVLAREGRAALLTSLPELVEFREMAITGRVVVSLFGQRPTILLAERA